MQTITTVLIDDEPAACRYLKNLLQQECPEVTTVAVAHNIEQGRNALNKHEPQLVLLDIDLPGGTGFDILDQSGWQNYRVVFTTAHQDYAIQAFRVAAVDYLLKPIDPAELKRAVQKVQHATNQRDERLDLLQQMLLKGNAPATIALRSGRL